MGDILVLGLGNVLMGDEGIGIQAVKSYSHDFGPTVDTLDGGTGGFHLLSLFASYKTVIIVDAALDDNPPGTINVIEPKYSQEFPKALSSHDIGLKDLIETASLLNQLPRVILITITVVDYRDVSTNLTPEVEQAIPGVHQKIDEVLKSILQSS